MLGASKGRTKSGVSKRTPTTVVVNTALAPVSATVGLLPTSINHLQSNCGLLVRRQATDGKQPLDRLNGVPLLNRVSVNYPPFDRPAKLLYNHSTVKTTTTKQPTFV